MRKLLVVFAVMSMVLAATAYSLWRGRDSERARADALQARIATLETQRPATTVYHPTPSSVPVTAEPGMPVEEAASATSIAEADADYNDYMARRRELLRDPKYYAAAHASMRSTFDERRFWMIRTLGVSPEMADQIVGHYIDVRLRDESNSWNPVATEQEQREHAEMLAQRRLEDAERLRAIAGDEIAAKLEEFVASHPSRNRANQLRNRLDATHDALRDDQIEPLIAVFHTEQTRFMKEAQEYLERESADVYSTEGQRKRQEQIEKLATASSRRTRSSASTILSSRQLAELDAMMRVEREIAQAQSDVHQMDEIAAGK